MLPLFDTGYSGPRIREHQQFAAQPVHVLPHAQPLGLELLLRALPAVVGVLLLAGLKAGGRREHKRKLAGPGQLDLQGLQALIFALLGVVLSLRFSLARSFDLLLQQQQDPRRQLEAVLLPLLVQLVLGPWRLLRLCVFEALMRSE